MSTIRNADLIMVMNTGDIIEQRKHEELLSRNGFMQIFTMVSSRINPKKDFIKFIFR
ncbi:MAG: hypothetical protein WA097_00605 [Candidatus Hydromicrobium sp.]